MSHKVTTLVRSRIVGSAAQKAVLENMADKASDGGEGVFASKPTIAAETELSLSTVKRSIAELIERGLIHEVGQRDCFNGHTVVYDMDIRAIAALPEWKVNGRKPEPRSSCTRPTVNPVHGEPGSPRTPTRFRVNPHPVQGEPQTVLEPSLNKEEPLVVPQTDDQPSKRRRSTSLPPGWVPSDRNLSDAHARNFTDQEIRHEADRFRDYHLARGTTFRDWDAGWRTWLGNARKFAAGGPLARGSQHGGGKPVGGLVGAAMRSEAAREH